MDLSSEVAVFTDTNLGTRLAVAVSPDITAGDLKREIGKEHHACFPNFGEIKVHALMVKRKSCFYHLPDFVPIQNAFQGLRGTWFLHVEANPGHNSDQPLSLQGLVAELNDSVHNGSKFTEYQNPEKHAKLDYDVMKNKFRKRRERFQQLDEALELSSPCNTGEGENRTLKEKRRNIFKGNNEGFLGAEEGCLGFSSRERLGHVRGNEMDCREDEWSSRTIIEGIQCESSSEVVSVTSIITKYFSIFDEVNQFDSPSKDTVFKDVVACEANHIYLHEPLKSKTNEYCSKMQVDNRLQYVDRTPFLSSCGYPNPGTSRRKLGREEVGERLVLAANNLSIAVSKNRPTISICQSKGGKIPLISSSPIASNINSFEINVGDN